MEPNPFPTIEPWPEPVEGARLLDDLCVLIRQYMVLPEYAAEVLALFVVHTYLVDAAWFTPYILVTSPVPGCGKSTLLDLLEPLVYRGQTTDSISGPSLRSRIARLRPTLMLDELDTQLHGPGAHALRGTLNSGYKKRGVLTVYIGSRQGERDFPVFCPKVLAGIGKVWNTVAERSIPIRLQKASPRELATLTKIRGHHIAAVCLPWCRKLRRFADDTLAVLLETDAVTPAGIGPRESDVWHPLLAIAEVTGPRWTVTARAAALAIHGKPNAQAEAAMRLLADLRTLFAAYQNPPSLHTKTIVQVLVAREDRPWAEYGRQGVLTPADVASLLADFDVNSIATRVGGVVAKGYKFADLRPAFHRHLSVCELGVDMTGLVSRVHRNIEMQ